MSKTTKIERFERRRGRVRMRLRGTQEKPRLAVFLSRHSIYAQLIDDDRGMTLVSASDRGSDRTQKQQETKTAHAKQVGTRVAQQALARGISCAVFDKSGYAFHGRVKALADAARAAGLRC